MKHIEFHGVALEKMNADQLTQVFKRIQEEVEYHRFDTGAFPPKVHVYASHLDMMADKSPKTHCVICI